MKNFRSYILENKNIKEIKSDIFSFILNKCQQWFNELEALKFQKEKELVEWLISQKYSLYRSVGNLPSGTYINNAENYRLPKDTPPLIQNLFDDALQRLGFTVLRRNSLFCSNSYQQASYYAKAGSFPFLVFPIDGYQYLFSEKIYDLYDLLKYQSFQNYLNIFKNKEEVKEYYDKFSKTESNDSLINFIKIFKRFFDESS